MTGPFTTPILRPADCLNPEQKARGAALLVAAEARPGSTGAELLRLAAYVVQGGVLSTEARDPWELFREPRETGMISTDPGPVAMNLDPVDRAERLANFGDLDSEDDGLG